MLKARSVRINVRVVGMKEHNLIQWRCTTKEMLFDLSLTDSCTATKRSGGSAMIYSITSSVWASNVGEIIKPSAPQTKRTRDQSSSLFALSSGERMVSPVAKYRLAYLSGSREVTAAGGLVSMAANLPELYERAAFYVDKILKGRDHLIGTAAA
jgi:hypothetical protein